jgi:hypothetical protein
MKLSWSYPFSEEGKNNLGCAFLACLLYRQPSHTVNKDTLFSHSSDALLLKPASQLSSEFVIGGSYLFAISQAYHF